MVYGDQQHKPYPIQDGDGDDGGLDQWYWHGTPTHLPPTHRFGAVHWR